MKYSKILFAFLFVFIPSFEGKAACAVPEDSIPSVTVRHINQHGSQIDYILYKVESEEDLRTKFAQFSKVALADILQVVYPGKSSDTFEAFRSFISSVPDPTSCRVCIFENRVR